MLYSQPFTVVRVIVVAVLSANVGATGAVCCAFVTVADELDVTLPVQFAAVTVTEIQYHLLLLLRNYKNLEKFLQNFFSKPSFLHCHILQ